jgi:dolichyl-phosphooligosaccharide-protein glycotransferase
MVKKIFSDKGWIVLIIIMALAFIMRTVGQWHLVFIDGQVLFRGLDADYHMRLADNMMKNFPIPLKWDIFNGYPNGSIVGYMPLLSWLIWLGGQFINYQVWGALLPPIFGALTLIPIYLIGKEFFNKTTALCACLFVAILPSEFFQRTLLGFTDHHFLETFFTTWIIWFLIKALKSNNWKWTIGSGVSLLFYLLSWHGGAFFILILLASYWIKFIINLKKGSPTINLSRTYIITGLIGLLAVPVLKYVDLLPLETLAGITLLVLLPVCLEALRRLLSNRPRPILVVSIAVPIAGAAVLSLIVPWYMNIAEIFWGFGSSIAECIPSTPTLIFKIFGITILLAILGLILLIREKKLDVLLGVWFLVMLLADIGQRRWSYYFIVPCSIMAGYTIYWVTGWVKPNLKYAVLFICLLFSLVPNIQTSIFVITYPNEITSNWYNSLIWMRDNTADPFSFDAYNALDDHVIPSYGVITWWDYGHWVERYARRVPIDSPTSCNEIGPDFLEAQSDEAANQIIKNLTIEYVIFDDQVIKGKWYAVVQLSNSDVENTKALLLNSEANRLWNGTAKGWTLVHQEGNVKIWQNTSAYEK